jgi:Oxoglutarate and iron-dependent oxygenase degradation C-term
LPECVQELLAALRSGPMFKLLSRMTDLEFDCDQTDGAVPLCSVEVQQWSRGCYTLLGSPTSRETMGDVLDVYLHFNSEMLPNDEDVGGDVCYLTHKIGKKKSKEVCFSSYLCLIRSWLMFVICKILCSSCLKFMVFLQLLRLSPAPNSMSLVYAQKGVDKIVKYLNNQYKFFFNTIKLEYCTMKPTEDEPSSPQSTDSESNSDGSMSP